MREATAMATCNNVATNTPAMCTGMAAFQVARSNGNLPASHRMPGVSTAHEYQ
jgi:hypothetical protein